MSGDKHLSPMRPTTVEATVNRLVAGSNPARVNRLVAGSNPARGAKSKQRLSRTSEFPMFHPVNLQNELWQGDASRRKSKH